MFVRLSVRSSLQIVTVAGWPGDGQTDRCTHRFPLHSRGNRPLWGRCPKKKKDRSILKRIQKERCIRKRKKKRLHHEKKKKKDAYRKKESCIKKENKKHASKDKSKMHTKRKRMCIQPREDLHYDHDSLG